MAVTGKGQLPTWYSRSPPSAARRGLTFCYPMLMVGLFLRALWSLCTPLVNHVPQPFLSKPSAHRHVLGLSLKAIPQHLQMFQECSIANLLATNLTFLELATPLSALEFVSRRDRLAQALVDDRIDVFAVEPGYTFQYYVNVSQPDWEVWEPEERPFVMIIEPE